MTSRCYKKFDLTEFQNDLEFNYSDEDTLEDLVHEYKLKAEKCLDKHVPKVTKRVTKWKMELWYNERITEQKSLVRRRERAWLKYVEEHQWKAFTIERNRFA